MNCIGRSHPQRMMRTPSVRPPPPGLSAPLPHARLQTSEQTARGPEHKQGYFITSFLFIYFFAH